MLTRAEPPANGQVREPPTVLTLYFSEPLERRFSSVRVVDQANAQVVDRVEFDDAGRALMRVYLKPLSPGYLTVAWENVSSVDGHRLSGSYPLTILNADGSVPAGQASQQTAIMSGATPRPARVIDRWAILVSATLLAGAFGFMALVSPGLPGPSGSRARGALDRRALALAGGAIAILLLATVAELLLQGADVGAGIGEVLGTRWGVRWWIREVFLVSAALSALMAVVTVRWRGHRVYWAVFGMLCASAYLGVSASVSHASVGGGSFWATASDFVHLLTAAVWIGMLPLLGLLFLWTRNHAHERDRYSILAAGLQRFSVVALVSVGLLLLTGVVNAVVEVEKASDLLRSGYGRTLLVKLSLMLPLLLIAGSNAYLLRPKLVEELPAHGGKGNHATLEELTRSLARRAKWELGIAVVVLGAAALLGQQTPTRGRLAAPVLEGGKFTESASAEGLSATLVIDPNQPGLNTFEVYLAGAVDTVESVRLDFTPPGASGSDARLIMEPSNPPTFYVGKGPYLAQAGKWEVAVNLRRRVSSDLALPFEASVVVPGTQAPSSRAGGAFASPLPASPVALGLIGLTAVSVIALLAGSLRPRGLVGGYASVAADSIQYRVRGLKPGWALAGLFIAGIGIGILVGSSLRDEPAPRSTARKNPVEATSASIERGQILFAQNCAMCHGDTGRGNGPLALTLPGPPANLYLHIPYHPDGFFYNVIEHGLSGYMPAFDEKLSEEEVWHLINFLRANFAKDPEAR